MAVYDRIYRGWEGHLEPAWSRFLVISRYSLQDVFRSRIFLAFFVACFLWPLVCGTAIYLHYNFEALELLELPVTELIKIDSWFFGSFFLRQQLALAFALILVVGPALVSPDLRNNALPLYLSRPLHKTDYVLGKLLVLVLLGSAITWVPGLVLWSLQSYLAGSEWMLGHLRVPIGIVVGSLLWIVVLSLFALAISAWVKWRPWATIFFLAIVFVGSAIGGIFNQIYDTWAGSLLIVWDQIGVVNGALFGIEVRSQMPAIMGLFALVSLGVVSTLLLYRRIRAFEVVS